MAGHPAIEITADMLTKVESFAAQGLTKDQIARSIGVSLSWFMKQQAEKPHFKEAILVGQAKGIATISNALFQRAKGYTHPEEKVFQHQGAIVTKIIQRHYPPDPTSMIFFLKNRSPEEWKDRMPEALPNSDAVTPSRVEVTVVDGRKSNTD